MHHMVEHVLAQSNPDPMSGLAAGLFIMVGLAVAMTLYVLPTAIAVLRRVPNAGSVAVVNILLGWSFVGWAVALAMAFRSVPAPVVGGPPPQGARPAPHLPIAREYPVPPSPDSVPEPPGDGGPPATSG